VLIADHRLPAVADGSNSGPHGLGVRTRDRVRQMTAEDGPVTALALASFPGLTPAAVRRHLDLLAEQGAIEAYEPAAGSRRGRGRPARTYILSETGHADMGSDYEDVTARAPALATTLTAEGFAASTRSVGGGTPLAGVELRQGHCPVQHVADQFPAFCDVETDAFSRLPGVDVQRVTTRAHGDRVCTTFIPATAVPVNERSAMTVSDEMSSP
jgi:predicted ArsR family transcriptional regulator